MAIGFMEDKAELNRLVAHEKSYWLLACGLLVLCSLAVIVLHLGSEDGRAVHEQFRHELQWTVGIGLPGLVILFCLYATLKLLEINRAKRMILGLRFESHRLDTLRQEAEEANQAKSQFLANMSHEIRTPMNAIVCMSELLLNTALDDEQHDFAETIHASSDALLTIVNDILDFSKIESGHLDMESRPFDVRDCAARAIALVAPIAARKKLNVRYDIDVSVPQLIIGDVTRLRQVLVNLLSNAVKFTQAGEVLVSATAKAAPGSSPPLSQIEFTVTDTGIGIPEESRSRLFKPFSQMDSSTTREFGGTGLGLAICYRLVEMMGGAISVESTPGMGSSFKFTIRNLEAQKAAQAHEGKTTLNLAGKGQLIDGDSQSGTRQVTPLTRNLEIGEVKPLRILIAEDNTVNQKVALHVLRRLGYRADVVTNGRQALNAIERQHYDLVFMDMQMPEMDGLASTREIRARLPRHRQPAIVAMTANAMVGDREKCLAAGMDDYIPKPVKMETLQMVLERFSKIVARNA